MGLWWPTVNLLCLRCGYWTRPSKTDSEAAIFNLPLGNGSRKLDVLHAGKWEVHVDTPGTVTPTQSNPGRLALPKSCFHGWNYDSTADCSPNLCQLVLVAANLSGSCFILCLHNVRVTYYLHIRSSSTLEELFRPLFFLHHYYYYYLATEHQYILHPL